MTITEFVGCTYTTQLSLLSDVGVKLTQYIQQDDQITLFTLYDFYVEMHYSFTKKRASHLCIYTLENLPDRYYEDMLQPKNNTKKGAITKPEVSNAWNHLLLYSKQ